jgi:hypothetical protein
VNNEQSALIPNGEANDMAIERPDSINGPIQRSHEQAIAAAGWLLQAACHEASVNAGWWNHEAHGDMRLHMRQRTRFGLALAAEKLCLTHSEVSEAMEGIRKNLMDDKLPHRPMGEVECADAVIRIADFCGAMGWDLGGAIAEKMGFNAHRPDHKPEARAAAGGKAF